MPRAVGFSTGSLALGDYRGALEAINCSQATAIELSALRESELEPLMAELPNLNVARFEYVSIHAPSSLQSYDESSLVRALQPAIDANLPIVVHADVIRSPAIWRSLGALLLIENMDKRKRTGRTATELRPLFENLPRARLCLDFAHARQIDPSLCEVVWIATEHRHRLAQLHLSELDSRSRHESLSFAAIAAVRYVGPLIPVDVPVILEFSADPHELDNHIRLAANALVNQPRIVRVVG